MRHRFIGGILFMLTIGGVSTPANANLLHNPGFESGWDGWFYEGGGHSLDLAASAARTGSLGLHMVVRTNYWTVVWSTTPILPGEQYTVHGYVRTENLTSNINTLAVYFLDSSQQAISTARYWYGPREGTTAWGKESITRTAPANAAYLRIFCWPFHANGDAYYDDFEILGPGPDPPPLGPTGFRITK